MFGTIIVLVALVLITPSLLGHPAELASWPILIVAMTHDKQTLLVDVTAFSQPYLYDNVTLDVGYETLANVTVPYENVSLKEAFSASLYVPVLVNATNATYDLYRNTLDVHARLVDRLGNYFELNVTVRLSIDSSSRSVMVFHFPDDVGSTATVTTTPPDDFRWSVPVKGAIP